MDVKNASRKAQQPADAHGCAHCPGHCCYRLPGAVLLITCDDINRLARFLAISDREVRKRYLENRYTFRVGTDNGCVFLNADRTTLRCTVYPARPDQCRRFPFGRPCPYLQPTEEAT